MRFRFGLVKQITNDFLRQFESEVPEGSEAIDIRAEPQVLIKAILSLEKKTDEGRLVRAVLRPWHDIIEILIKDPNAAFQFTAEQWEHIIAGIYKESGFDEVILTPRSGDFGRDVIAVKKGVGQVRVIDQVKAYAPEHRVTANDVRALVGVLQLDGATKGFLTTTAEFAPGIYTDPLIAPLMPSRLELVDGQKLLKRLTTKYKTLNFFRVAQL